EYAIVDTTTAINILAIAFVARGVKRTSFLPTNYTPSPYSKNINYLNRTPFTATKLETVSIKPTQSNGNIVIIEAFEKLQQQVDQQNQTIELLQQQVQKLKKFKNIIAPIGIAPDSTKLEAVQKIQLSQNITQLRLFLELARYYRQFIQNFSAIAKPLKQLLQKNKLYQ
ncbi:31762_t:CDS:2, partial [Gigaspora margarita]